MDQKEVDIVIAALCCWREARGETTAAKTAQLCCVRNRVKAHWINDWNFQDVCEHPWQFSGMTAKGDPNLSVWPKSTDPTWKECLMLADDVVNERRDDPTGGAVFYHDVSIPTAPAVWGKVTETMQVGRLVFYRMG